MEQQRGNPSTSKPPTLKLDRRTVEKNRRTHMHLLLQNLFSLIPSQHLQLNSKEGLALPEKLERATNYMKQLRDRVERLKEAKAKAEATRLGGGGGGDADDSMLPMLKLIDLQGTGVQVITVTRQGLAVSEVVRVLQDQGMEVVGVNIATVGDKVYHIINAQVIIPRIGVDTTRIAGRIHELISESTQPSS